MARVLHKNGSSVLGSTLRSSVLAGLPRYWLMVLSRLRARGEGQWTGRTGWVAGQPGQAMREPSRSWHLTRGCLTPTPSPPVTIPQKIPSRHVSAGQGPAGPLDAADARFVYPSYIEGANEVSDRRPREGVPKTPDPSSPGRESGSTKTPTTLDGSS